MQKSQHCVLVACLGIVQALGHVIILGTSSSGHVAKFKTFY